MNTTFESYSALRNTQSLQDAAKGTFLSLNRVFIFKNNEDGKIMVKTYHIGQRIFAALKSILCRISYGEALTGKKVTLLKIADIQAEIQKADALGTAKLKPSTSSSEQPKTPPQSPMKKKRVYPSYIPTPVGSPARMNLNEAPVVLPSSPAVNAPPTFDLLISNVMTALSSKQANAWDVVVQHIDQVPVNQADACWVEIHNILKYKAENYVQSFTDLIQSILQKSKSCEDHLKRITQVLANYSIVVYRLNSEEAKQAEVEHSVQFLPKEIVPETVAPETLIQLFGFQRNIRDMCGSKPGFDLLVQLTEHLAAHPSFFLYHYLEKMYEAIAWKHQDPQSKLSLSETQLSSLLKIKSDVVDVLRLWSAPHTAFSCADYCNELKKYDKYFIRAHVPLLLQDFSMILQGGSRNERALMRPIVQEYFCAETILPLLNDANPEWTCMILNALLLTYCDESDCAQPIKEIFENESLENLLLSKERISALCSVSDGNGKKMVSFLWHQCNDTARFAAFSRLDMDELLTESSFVDAIKAFCADDQSIKKSPEICQNMLIKILDLEMAQDQLDSSFWTKQIQQPKFVVLKDHYNKLGLS